MPAAKPNGKETTGGPRSVYDEQSPIWKAFRVAFAHHSTALEGNQLTKGETQLAIDEYAEGISMGLGLSKELGLPFVTISGHRLPSKDVEEVVNHASALEYTRQNLFNKEITLEKIVKLNRILYRDHSHATTQGLQATLFRKIPVSVAGSPTIRPYPHEAPAVMENLLQVHQEQAKRLPPPVNAALLMIDFCYVHPFADGNGRTARTLLLTELSNAGYYGCVIPKKD
ncbi:Cell filamentation protein Fic [Balamuthia mandrillaris]